MGTSSTKVKCSYSVKEALNKLIPFMVLQAHHERDQPLLFVLSLSKDLISAFLMFQGTSWGVSQYMKHIKQQGLTVGISVDSWSIRL